MTTTPKSRPRLTNLLRVEERLTEAEYFARRMFDLPNSCVLGYELNAFLSAARSVTFLLQKEFAAVPCFKEWWAAERAKLGADEAARFFLELRNFSQKEGRVSAVGGSDRDGKRRYMFAGTSEPVPPALINRDVADCCLEHLAKLANVVLKVTQAFPHHSCPARALTPEGVAALGLDLDAIEMILGFPPAVSAARPAGSTDELTKLYRRFVDSVDFEEIGRIAGYVAMPAARRSHDFGMSLALSMVDHIENSGRDGGTNDDAMRTAIVAKILKIKSETND